MITGCSISIPLPPIPDIPKKPDWYKEYKKNRVIISGYLKEWAKTDSALHVASKYALLVNSYTTLKHRENMQMAYESLIGSGFPAENIFVLRCTPYHHYRARTLTPATREGSPQP